MQPQLEALTLAGSMSTILYTCEEGLVPDLPSTPAISKGPTQQACAHWAQQ